MSVSTVYYYTLGVAIDPKHMKWLAPLLLAVDAVLCALIIWKIPCKDLQPSPHDRVLKAEY
jgi:hypothetical protein